jgi:hypothetical protein
MRTDEPAGRRAVLFLGEIHTGLLQNSSALPPDHAEDLLDLAAGERVRRFERPISHAVSADRLTGVDCALPSTDGRETRCVGTVTGHAIVTGGHVAQGSAYTAIVDEPSIRRLAWSHYLARPGILEAIGKLDTADVRRATGPGTLRQGVLDLGAISARTLDEVQRSDTLDRRPPMRSRRTRMRWSVTPVAADRVHASFRVDSDVCRTLELRVPVDKVDVVVELCEDLALHDWLLTTLVGILETSLTGSGTHAQRVERLRPAVDYLLHLWMPAARVDDSVAALWRSLEHRPGFTRQWEASVSRIRDQIAMATITLLQSVGTAEPAARSQIAGGRGQAKT